MKRRNTAYDVNIYGPIGTHFQEVRMLTVPDKMVTKLFMHAESI